VHQIIQGGTAYGWRQFYIVSSSSDSALRLDLPFIFSRPPFSLCSFGHEITTRLRTTNRRGGGVKDDRYDEGNNIVVISRGWSVDRIEVIVDDVVDGSVVK
jgi:hypothetical protein